jgi:hypothetical protein
MSVRFEKFFHRIGKKSEFLPLKNRLLNAMKDEAKLKRKNYPRLIEKMTEKWENEGYKKEMDIAHLLADNVDEFLTNYLNTLLPFRIKGLKYTKIATPSRLDFIITTEYIYTEKEIDVMKNYISSHDLPKNPSIEQLCKFLLLYSINSFALPIEDVFQRPFAFIPQNLDTELHEKTGQIKVSVSVQGREQ